MFYSWIDQIVPPKSDYVRYPSLEYLQSQFLCTPYLLGCCNARLINQRIIYLNPGTGHVSQVSQTSTKRHGPAASRDKACPLEELPDSKQQLNSTTKNRQTCKARQCMAQADKSPIASVMPAERLDPPTFWEIKAWIAKCLYLLTPPVTNMLLLWTGKRAHCKLIPA